MKPGAVFYTDTYREECFQIWYSAGHPSFTIERVNKMFPEFQGNKPDIQTIHRWMREHNWKERAQELDNKALAITNTELIAKKVEVLKQQFEDASKVRKAAVDFLLSQDGGFDTSAAAVQALFKAAELERKTIGLSEALSELANMTQDQLNKRIAELASRVSPEDFVEGVEVDTESK